MHAFADRQRKHRRLAGWIDSADRLVLSLHRSGFMQSLTFHVALLLAMAITTIEPDRSATSVRLALAFDAVADAPIDEPEMGVAAAPLADLVIADFPAADAPIPSEAWDLAPEQPRHSLDDAAVELANLDAGDQVGGLDVAEMLAEVPNSVRLAGVAAGRAGQHGAGPGLGGGGGFGGELGRRLKAAGARTGDVQVSIAWDNFNDIDVHVMVESVAPRRGISMINYGNPRGSCGGWLDVDQNIVPMTPAAVENVFWPRGTAPYGRYTVYVHHFRNWGGANPTEVHVAVLVDGRESHHTAVVHAGSGPVVVTSFVRKPHALGRPPVDDFQDSLAPSSPP